MIDYYCKIQVARNEPAGDDVVVAGTVQCASGDEANANNFALVAGPTKVSAGPALIRPLIAGLATRRPC